MIENEVDKDGNMQPTVMICPEEDAPDITVL